MLTHVCLASMLICMRTTLNIDDNLMKRVKRYAARSRKTITEVVEEALRREVSGDPLATGRFRLRWEPVEGRLLPGIDLADRDSLLDAMEERG